MNGGSNSAKRLYNPVFLRRKLPLQRSWKKKTKKRKRKSEEEHLWLRQP